MRTFFRRLGSWWNNKSKPQTVPISPSASSPAVSPIPPRPPVQSAVAGSEDEATQLNEALVYKALRNCRDPEIPVNIVDLGLIYDVRIAEDVVHVKMTLTTQGCGMGGYISQEAEEQIRALPGVRAANVEIVWEPPWDPSMITHEGKKTLGLPE